VSKALQLKMEIRMKFIVLAISFMFPLLGMANPVPTFPFVIVTEKIDQKVKPDLAKINFNIVAYAKTSNKAMEQLTKDSVEMLEVLRKHEIPISNLESTQVEKDIKKAIKDGVYSHEISGYDVYQVFHLRLTDLEKYPGLMNDLVRLDGVRGIQARFETTKEGEYKDRMIVELSAKVRKKADTLANAQSRKVKRVYGITTEGNFGQAYALFSLEYTPQVSYSRSSDRTALVMAVPKSIEVSQRITAIYELK
jgi:uncharacterized protein YggE